MGKEKKCTLYKKYTSYKKCIPYLILAGFTFFFCWWFVGRHGIFGAKVDWLSQHSVLPDYFRQQFYATGKIFPEFAPNLGGGQNIYHFAYYGLYSPLILPSYLLPFVKMSDYIMVISITGLTVSVLLFYYWLKSRKMDTGGIVVDCGYLHRADVPAGGPDDRTVQRSDHVRRLYAVLMSGTYRCGPVF